ncbi:hypothetical protein PUNSTDRAFT_128907 [Punctularia strigosozonata HHB-11173 SS5]|uniref:uncharacterized protein n=1 Tax=Punctularia strigosozonata (strain HHB-11173) TaxID=741275 RepID=UPI0004417954|nr:uncharacterized protein PUNSTDRAFT_128907 [Punctularia strigosozonata HHB-11173 SS5]EIN13217.1 hypothetical protein PUNSTDRAFT_128907 [Punctularia strigosozonata HHB-11173 SS5]
MHRVLLINEIVRIIFANNIDYAKRDNGLLSCAYTCKAWAQIALDDIWQTLTDFEILLKILPSYEETRQGQWSFSREPTGAEWGRFESYCRRVTGIEIEHRTFKHIAESVFDSLLARDRARRLFPRMDWLLFNPETFCARHATIFLTSAMKSFIISDSKVGAWEVEVVEDVKYFLRTLLATSTPNMTDIHVGGPVFDLPLLEKLCELDKLNSLNLNLMAEFFRDDERAVGLIRRLWELPDLQRMEVKLDPSMRTIAAPDTLHQIFEEIPDDDADDPTVIEELQLEAQIPAVCDLVRLLPALNLDISTMKPEPQEVWDELLDLVFRLPAEHACELRIHFNRPSDPPDWQRPISALFFLQMPRFTALTSLRISVAFKWTDTVVDHIARSCPALQNVSLMRSQEYAEDETQLTCASLKSFAVHCPQLWVLHININPTRITPDHTLLPAGHHGNTSLRMLMLEEYMWIEGDLDLTEGRWCHRLSEVIDHLFPRLNGFAFWPPPRPGTDAENGPKEVIRARVLGNIRNKQRRRGLQPPDLIRDEYPLGLWWV